MPNVREIFGADESDSGDHESDAEDHESDARLSQSHGMFGSSDRLFVGDLGGELAMLVGGDFHFHGNFTLDGGDLHASSIPDAPRRVGAGLNTRAGDELPGRSAACSEGVGARHSSRRFAHGGDGTSCPAVSVPCCYSSDGSRHRSAMEPGITEGRCTHFSSERSLGERCVFKQW